MNRITLSILILAITLCHCSTRNAANHANENFINFISRFNTDAVFRTDRVRYKVNPSMDLNLSHVDTTRFKIITTVNDSAVIKIVDLTNSSYWVKFIFKLEDGKWFLTNYIDTYDD